MEPHGILTLYSVKAFEYLVALAYLVLFVPFWRYVRERPTPVARVGAEAMADWFALSADVVYHPGHAWARREDGLVTVGMDDFAQRLLGSVEALELPPVGAALRQGERGWSVTAGGETVDMLSPVDGVVAAVNPRVFEWPGRVNRDPYGDGWLVKLLPMRWPANARQLLSGRMARQWMAGVAEGLRARIGPEPGVLLQDGGTPIAGFARELDPERPGVVARSFFLSQGGES